MLISFDNLIPVFVSHGALVSKVPGQMPEMRLAINGPTASGRSSAEPRSQHQNVGITRQPQSSSAHAETAQLNGPASELMELKRQHELLEKLLNQQKEVSSSFQRVSTLHFSWESTSIYLDCSMHLNFRFC